MYQIVSDEDSEVQKAGVNRETEMEEGEGEEEEEGFTTDTGFSPHRSAPPKGGGRDTTVAIKCDLLFSRD